MDGGVVAQRIGMMISNLPPAMALVRSGKLQPAGRDHEGAFLRTS